jgi:hypothetical protein
MADAVGLLIFGVMALAGLSDWAGEWGMRRLSLACFALAVLDFAALIFVVLVGVAQAMAH